MPEDRRKGKKERNTLENLSMAAAFLLVQENLFGHTAFVQQRTSGMRVADLTGSGRVQVVDSGLASDTFNKVLWNCGPDLRPLPHPGPRAVQPAASVAEAAACLRAARDYLEAAGRDFSNFPIWAGEAVSAPDSPLSLLEKAGYAAVETETAMILRAEDMPAALRTRPAHNGIDAGGIMTRTTDRAGGLRIVRATSPALLDAFADVLAANWNPPDETVRVFFRRAAPCLLVPESPMRLFVGLAGDVPVCCGELFLSHGGRVAGLHMIATRAAFRRRGFGLAMSAALVAAAGDAPLAVLLASDEGEPVYRRLGFTTCGTFAECAEA